MGDFVMPKHTGSLREFTVPLKVCYESRNENEGWIPNGHATRKEDGFTYSIFQEYKSLGVEKEPKSDNSDYTKDAQIPLYLGFIEGRGRNNAEKRITPQGIKMHEAIVAKNLKAQYELLIDAFERNSFGRNNQGFPSSDSDVEVPNVLLISSILLDGITRQEFYYVIFLMHTKGWDLARAVSEILYHRMSGDNIPQIPTIYTDCKLIPLFVSMEFLTEDVQKRLHIAKGVYEDFAKRILRLRTKNEEILNPAISQHDEGVLDEDEDSQLNAKSVSFDKNLLTAMKTKPFLLLAGISGTGKSRIVKQMAFESCPNVEALRGDKTSPGNYQLIEVKPNWHDSTEVLGYESEIGGKHYVATPFVKFLVKAMCYPDVPFFVCMDEMNLAPVEQYFAEFLSVLESRKLVDGKITSESLIDADIFASKDYELKLQDELLGLELKEESAADGYVRIISGKLSDEKQKIYDKLKKEGLRIPSNLIVVGTVNMDETTHQFSRKVIDRAMTIEMNIEDSEGPFVNFFMDCKDLDYSDTPQTKELFLPTVVQAKEALDKLSEGDKKHLIENIPTILHNLNQALNGTPFKIAYRVQNELVIYFYELRQEKENVDVSAPDLLNKAMDAILMLKVLPRIEGDEDLLKEPLGELLKFTVSYDEAHKKIKEMQTRLENGYFTSFWP